MGRTVLVSSSLKQDEEGAKVLHLTYTGRKWIIEGPTTTDPEILAAEASRPHVLAILPKCTCGCWNNQDSEPQIALAPQAVAAR